MAGHPQRRDARQRLPAWDAVRMVALEDQHLPRVLAGMGFVRRLATFARGDLAWWRPEYRRVPPWQDAPSWQTGSSLAARGMRAGKWDDAAVALQDAWQARDRAAAAEINRHMRDAEVFMMQAPDGRPFQCIYIDASFGMGEWRDLSNAVRGDCLITLGMLMWQEPRFGRAAARLARLAGMRHIPDLPPPDASVLAGLAA